MKELSIFIDESGDFGEYTHYSPFYIVTMVFHDVVEASGKLSRLISVFIREHYDEFLPFDIVKIYYDNGQIELSKILSSVFNAMLPRIEFRKVLPSDYKLFQISDLLCSFYLINLKLEHGYGLSHSELMFFGNIRDLKKNYLKPLKKKEWC